MRPFLFSVALLTYTSLAAPINFNDIYNFSDDLADFYSRVSQHIDHVKDSIDSLTSCDKSKIALPKHASGLPSTDGQKPLYVSVGRGTQNYTCSSSSSDETPKAIGALATLYDVTCTAANFPHMLTMITKIAYNMNLPTNFDNFLSSLPPANLAVLGHHYFQNSVPIFNLNTPTHQGGLAFTKLEDKLDSPSDAVQGGNGAVAWLALSTVEGTVGEYSSVYRVNTAGGAPPKTCQNMPSHFEVEYSANYYFFGK